MGKRSGEEGVGRDKDGRAAGEGVIGSRIEQVDLREKNKDEANNASPFVALKFQVDFQGARPNIDDEAAEQETHAGQAERWNTR